MDARLRWAGVHNNIIIVVFMRVELLLYVAVDIMWLWRIQFSNKLTYLFFLLDDDGGWRSWSELSEVTWRLMDPTTPATR